MAYDPSEIGSVGHLIGAAMETAGHYVHSELLKRLDLGFASSMGVLIFTIAACSAVFAWVVLGGYKLSKWFLIGPALFWFMISHRVPSYGAKWQFGSDVYSAKYVAEAAQPALGGLPGAQAASAQGRQTVVGEVSWAFALLNKVTSGLTQGAVSAVNYLSKNAEASFVAKIDRYYSLQNVRLADADARNFLILGPVSKCSNYYRLMRDYYSESTDVLWKSKARDLLLKQGNKAVLSGADYQTLTTWLTDRNLLDARKIAEESGMFLSCNDLWRISIVVLRHYAHSYIEELIANTKTPGMTEDQIRKQLMDKFSASSEWWTTNPVSLDDNQKAVLMINEVAARMLLNEIQRSHPSLIQLQYPVDKPFFEGGHYHNEARASSSLRKMLKADEYEEKGDFFMAMLSMPYLQGMVLYFLAVGFPLFAFALLVPGRHGGFIMWMGLWMWVKLWDVGFAVVMLLDNYLYEIMPHGALMTNDVVGSPGDSIKALLEVDPTYSVYTYYHILATCIAAVPIISGLVVRKAGHDFMTLVGSSLTTFSGRIGGSMGAYARSLSAQTDFAQFANNFYRAFHRAQGGAMKNPAFEYGRQQYVEAKAASLQFGALFNIANQSGVFPGQDKPDAWSKAWAAKLSAYSALSQSAASRMHEIMGTAQSTHIDTVLMNEGISPRAMELSLLPILTTFNSHHVTSGTPGFVLGNHPVEERAKANRYFVGGPALINAIQDGIMSSSISGDNFGEGYSSFRELNDYVTRQMGGEARMQQVIQEAQQRNR